MGAKQTSKKTQQKPVLVTIDPKWQLVFVTVMLATVAIPAGLVWWTLIRQPSQEGGLGTGFMFGQTFYPFMFIAVGYLFALAKVRGVLPRLFWAVFLGMIGISIYYALQIPMNYLSNTLNLYSTGPEGNWWSSTGWIWTQMGIVLVLYSVTLGILAKRKHRS